MAGKGRWKDWPGIRTWRISKGHMNDFGHCLLTMASQAGELYCQICGSVEGGFEEDISWKISAFPSPFLIAGYPWTSYCFNFFLKEHLWLAAAKEWWPLFYLPLTVSYQYFKSYSWNFCFATEREKQNLRWKEMLRRRKVKPERGYMSPGVPSGWLWAPPSRWKTQQSDRPGEEDFYSRYLGTNFYKIWNNNLKRSIYTLIIF